ncbi:MAG: STAS-like domain-containing protein [Methylomonas sp.]
MLRKYFKRTVLNSEGATLSRIVTEHLLSSDKLILIDFDSISKVSSIFFQDFIFPLILEFGHETVTRRMDFINLSDEIHLTYQEAFSKSSEYIDRIAARHTRTFGDISDITFELLIKARELARRDPSAAHIIFGLSSGLIESLASMDIDQVRRVSCSGIICFEPRFTPEFASKLAALSVDEIDAFLNVIGGIDMDGVYDSEYH